MPKFPEFKDSNCCRALRGPSPGFLLHFRALSTDCTSPLLSSWETNGRHQTSQSQRKHLFFEFCWTCHGFNCKVIKPETQRGTSLKRHLFGFSHSPPSHPSLILRHSSKNLFLIDPDRHEWTLSPLSSPPTMFTLPEVLTGYNNIIATGVWSHGPMEDDFPGDRTIVSSASPRSLLTGPLRLDNILPTKSLEVYELSTLHPEWFMLSCIHPGQQPGVHV